MNLVEYTFIIGVKHYDDLQTLRQELDQHFTGYTSWPARGVWDGVVEWCLVVTIALPQDDGPYAASTVRRIAHKFEQTYVYIKRSTAEVTIPKTLPTQEA